MPPRPIGRSNSQISALSAPSCCQDDGQQQQLCCDAAASWKRIANEEEEQSLLPADASMSSKLLCAPLQRKESSRKVPKKSFRTSRWSHSSKRSTTAAVQQLLSSVSFSNNAQDDDDEDDDEEETFDCNSTVSSLGMGFLNESNHEEKDGLLPTEEQDDDILQLRAQIQLLRRSSMERFEANGWHSSSSPKMPRKSVDDGDHSIARSMWPASSSPTSVTATAWMDDVSAASPPPPLLSPISNHVSKTRSTSLPTGDLSKLVVKMMESGDRHADVAAPAEAAADEWPLSIRRTDRWSCGATCNQTMLRDTELVKQSFERASSLRNHSNHKSNHNNNKNFV